MSPKKRKKPRVLTIAKKIFSTISSETFRIFIAIIVVLGLTWGIAKATENELESATNNFSVIGTVSSISDETLSLIEARGTDTKDEELYNLNIKYLDRIETKEYQPLIISDIKPGDTIVAQGVTNGSTFFIKRIVSFAGITLPVQEETATTTEDVFATSTDQTSSTTESTTSTTPILDTITEIIENGLDQVSDVLDTIVDTITGSEEPSTQNISQEQPVPDSEINSLPQE